MKDKPTHLDSWCPSGLPQSAPPPLGSGRSSAQTADRKAKKGHTHTLTLLTQNLTADQNSDEESAEENAQFHMI